MPVGRRRRDAHSTAADVDALTATAGTSALGGGRSRWGCLQGRDIASCGRGAVLEAPPLAARGCACARRAAATAPAASQGIQTEQTPRARTIVQKRGAEDEGWRGGGAGWRGWLQLSAAQRTGRHSRNHAPPWFRHAGDPTPTHPPNPPSPSANAASSRPSTPCVTLPCLGVGGSDGTFVPFCSPTVIGAPSVCLPRALLTLLPPPPARQSGKRFVEMGRGKSRGGRREGGAPPGRRARGNGGRKGSRCQ